MGQGKSSRKGRKDDSSPREPRAVATMSGKSESAPAAESVLVPTPPAWPANWLAPMYIALILIGFVVLWSGGASVGGDHLPADRAMFMAVNAVTLTGFSEAVHVDQLKPVGQIAVFFLTVAGSIVSLFVAGLAVSRVARRPYTWQLLLQAAVFAEAGAILLGMLLLWNGDRNLWQAMFQAAAAFGNSGAYIGSDPTSAAAQTYLVIIPWSFLGGIGLPVLVDIFYLLQKRRPLSVYAMTALRLAALAYLIGVAFLAILQLVDLPPDQWTTGTISSVLISSSVLSIESRTLGMPIVAIDTTRHTVQWGLLLMMTVGGMSGGTAGGLKITTIAELFNGIRGTLSGKAIGRSTGIAATWVAMYCAIVFITVILTLRTDPRMPGDQLLFDAVSAVSNVGLSHHEMASSAASMFSLAAAMLLGRLTSTFVLWWLVDTAPSAEMPVG